MHKSILQPTEFYGSERWIYGGGEMEAGWSWKKYLRNVYSKTRE